MDSWLAFLYHAIQNLSKMQTPIHILGEEVLAIYIFPYHENLWTVYNAYAYENVVKVFLPKETSPAPTSCPQSLADSLLNNV